jgi:hypothetical protein
VLEENPQALFDQFVPKARAYLEQPGVMAALELDRICMKLYPVVARKLGNTSLSNQIRDFGRGLPRKETDELAVLLEEILENARQEGLQATA